LGEVLNAPGRDTKSELVLYTATDTLGVVWGTLDIQVVDVG